MLDIGFALYVFTVVTLVKLTGFCFFAMVKSCTPSNPFMKAVKEDAHHMTNRELAEKYFGSGRIVQGVVSQEVDNNS
jgi:hypothetical protein